MGRHVLSGLGGTSFSEAGNLSCFYSYSHSTIDPWLPLLLFWRTDIHDLHSFIATFKTQSEFLLLCFSKGWKWLWILGLQLPVCLYHTTPHFLVSGNNYIWAEYISKRKLNAEVCASCTGRSGTADSARVALSAWSWRQGWQELGPAEGGQKPSEEFSSPVFKEQGLLRKIGGGESCLNGFFRKPNRR